MTHTTHSDNLELKKLIISLPVAHNANRTACFTNKMCGNCTKTYKGIGEDEHTTVISKADSLAQEDGSNVVQLKQKATAARNRYRTEPREALKAIKEKYQL